MTRISDLLAAGPTWSFEFFPPKTPEGAVALHETVRELADLRPDFVSVTYGAGAELVSLLEDYRASGIHNVLALAGDPPVDGSDAGGDFTYASELVELVHDVDHFTVAVAAFPEIHPRSPDRASDRRHLAAKLAAADFGMTQFFWEVEHYERMVAELADLGCTTPVLPGVMPFVNVAGARRMSAMNNTHIPASLQERMDVVDGDPEATRKLGVEVATDLVAGLLELGVPGVHLYALNRANSITEIYDNLAIRPT